ncbi:MAG: hypothetical protein ABW321_09500 [Polyangiales bacterium]
MAARPCAKALLALLCLAACTPQGDPGIGPSGFSDDFERTDLGDQWNNTGGPYKIVKGQLKVEGARNKPLWLRRTLPHDVSIELDVQSASADGDIKLEVFGDGVSKAETTSYTATSYVVIFGGWRNTLNVLARMNEHGKDRVVGPTFKVEPGRTYHMKIERRGDTIKAWVDDRELASLKDPEPLSGVGHDHFAFNNWAVPLTFDNLRVRAL